MSTLEMDPRADLLATEADARLTWDLAVGSVPATAVAEPALPEGHSVKDLVAHIAGWERWSSGRISARREGRTPAPIPDWERFEHAFNEELRARWRDVPWPDVRSEADASHAEFRGLIEALGEDDLFGDRGLARLIAATESEHVAPYVEQIRVYVEGLPLQTEFGSDRLRLRSFRPSDAPFLFAMFGDPEVMRYIPPSPPITIERARLSADRRIAMERRDGFTLWMVERRDTGEPIGNCGFAMVENKGPDVEIAYHYVRSAWGKGYGTEAAAACLARGFGALGFERVFAFCYPENTGSWRVMEKAGMRADGLTDYLGIRMKRFVADRATWRAPRA